MSFEVPNLPYAFDALEPHIDARTMEIHHDKHHAAYVNMLNGAVEAAGDACAGKSVEELICNLDAVPEAQRGAVRNHGGGHYNHSLFWTVMAADGGSPGGELAGAIDADGANNRPTSWTFATPSTSQSCCSMTFQDSWWAARRSYKAPCATACAP